MKFFRPDVSDKDLLKSIRCAIVIITIICVGMSVSRNANIFDLVAESSAFQFSVAVCSPNGGYLLEAS